MLFHRYLCFVYNGLLCNQMVRFVYDPSPYCVISERVVGFCRTLHDRVYNWMLRNVITSVVVLLVWPGTSPRTRKDPTPKCRKARRCLKHKKSFYRPVLNLRSYKLKRHNGKWPFFQNTNKRTENRNTSKDPLERLNHSLYESASHVNLGWDKSILKKTRKWTPP